MKFNIMSSISILNLVGIYFIIINYNFWKLIIPSTHVDIHYYNFRIIKYLPIIVIICTKIQILQKLLV